MENKLYNEIEESLKPENIKKDEQISVKVMSIESEYSRQLSASGFILPLNDLKIFLNKVLMIKDYYDLKEATMRANAERMKTLKEIVFAKEKEKIEKGSDAERNRKVLANSEMYHKAEELYHHYNKMFRFFEKRSSSAENKLFNCKALLKKDE